VRVQNGGRPPGREVRLLDVYNERPVRVSAKVLVPVKEHPKVINDSLSVRAIKMCHLLSHFVHIKTGVKNYEKNIRGFSVVFIFWHFFSPSTLKGQCHEIFFFWFFS
jgi:hypothetical protein